MRISPDKKYKIIYADPPWQYKDKAVAGKRGVEFKYKTMNLDTIKSLPIKEIIDDNAILFLWSTMPMLPDAMGVISAWGFKFKTTAFIWIKTNPKSATLFWGMGNWTRACGEVCLLGVRGTPKRQSAAVHSVIIRPRLRHSEKPPEIRDRIVQLCGDIPRIELFACQQVEGWDSIGFDIDGLDITESIEKLIVDT